MGIYDSEPANILAGANQVYYYYCSSDSWNGQGSRTYTSEDGTASYSMFERGHVIFTAGIAELEVGVTAAGGDALPPLVDAATVVLSGTSAGSNGAQLHADWLRDRLEGNGTAVIAIFDAAHNPPREVIPEPTIRSSRACGTA